MRPKLRDLVAALLDDTAYPDLDALCSALIDEREADLLESLAAQLTVPETHFFRVAPQIAALHEQVLPSIISRAEPNRHLRIWSAGCSTGEEPYTVAILLRELLGDAAGWHLDLVASDLSRHALDVAREAVYSAWSFRDTPGHIQERYFTRDGARWRLADSIRRMVRFFPLNLAHFPLRRREIAEQCHHLFLGGGQAPALRRVEPAPRQWRLAHSRAIRPSARKQRHAADSPASRRGSLAA
jgi:chemotaxis methyl-accepting protein methylase